MTFQEPLWSVARQIAPLLANGGTALQLLSRSECVDKVTVLSPEHLDGGIICGPHV